MANNNPPEMSDFAKEFYAAAALQQNQQFIEENEQEEEYKAPVPHHQQNQPSNYELYEPPQYNAEPQNPAQPQFQNQNNNRQSANEIARNTRNLARFGTGNVMNRNAQVAPIQRGTFENPAERFFNPEQEQNQNQNFPWQNGVGAQPTHLQSFPGDSRGETIEAIPGISAEELEQQRQILAAYEAQARQRNQVQENQPIQNFIGNAGAPPALAPLRNPAQNMGIPPPAGAARPAPGSQRAQQIARQKQEQVNDGCFSCIILMMIFLGLSSGATECHNFILFTKIEGIYYTINLIFVYRFYQKLKQGHESLYYTFFNCFLNFIQTCILMWGYSIYWPNMETCDKQWKSQQINTQLNWVMILELVFGFMTMLKCCAVTTVFLCFCPQFMRAWRNRGRADAGWVPTNTSIVRKIMKQKFNPTAHSETECVICMVDYEANDDITPLPCDERHYFHSECIENWLKNNNSCPLCKKPITLEDLKNQKKNKSKNVNRNSAQAQQESNTDQNEGLLAAQ